MLVFPDESLTFSRGTAGRRSNLSANARFFAAFNGSSKAIHVFDHTFTNLLTRLAPAASVGAVAVNPDGRWLTAGPNVERTIRLRDVDSGKVIQTTTTSPNPRGLFSSDGRWLAVTGGWGFHLYETGTWKPPPPLSLPSERPILGAAAFSPDIRLLALVVNQFTVQLFDLQRFEPKVTLHPPGDTQMRGQALSE